MAKKVEVPTTKSGLMAALAEAGEVSKKQAAAIYELVPANVAWRAALFRHHRSSLFVLPFTALLQALLLF